jgi:uncharacterized protein (DUF305 family)
VTPPDSTTTNHREDTEALQPDGEGAEPTFAERAGFGAPTWPKAIALAIAVGFLAAAVAMVVTRHSDNAARPASDSIDVGFLRDMTQHHDQAVLMSGYALETDMPDLVVRSYARDIMRWQSRQIGDMGRQLTVWGYPNIDPNAPVMQWMPMQDIPGMGGMSGTMKMTISQMPGIATDAQLNELQRTRGRAAEELFMTLMIRHHEGGILMANYAAHHAHTAYVRGLAAGMAQQQSEEISEMRLSAQQLGLTLGV